MLRKMVFALFGLVFLSGQECPSDPITSSTTGTPPVPVSNPALPAPLPLANVATWHFYDLPPLETEDVSLYSQSNVAYQLVNGQFLEVGIDHARGKASFAWLRFATYSLPADLEVAVLALYATGDSLTRPAPIFLDAPIGPWSESSTVQSLPQIVTGNVASAAPKPGEWFILNFDLSPLIRGWNRGDFPNHGIQLRPDVSTGTGLLWNTFCSTDYYDPSYRPVLCARFIDAGPPRFKFPLDGKYSPERIGNYFHFGSHWGKTDPDGVFRLQYCSQSGMESVPLLHNGIDLVGDFGDPVYAVERGVVEYSAQDYCWGGYLVIRHDDIDRSETFVSVYEHLVPNVKLGDSILKGQVVGKLISGSCPYAPHLHFAVRWGTSDPGDPTNAQARIGRLPKRSCTTGHSPSYAEPAFPENFSDPQQMLWEE